MRKLVSFKLSHNMHESTVHEDEIQTSVMSTSSTTILFTLFLIWPPLFVPKHGWNTFQLKFWFLYQANQNRFVHCDKAYFFTRLQSPSF